VEQAPDRQDFEQQLMTLIDEHGAETFAAPAGALPERTLFVDGDRLVAEGEGSPRHRYGLFFENGDGLAGRALETAIRAWVRGGKAYAQYISMNVCRFC